MRRARDRYGADRGSPLEESLLIRVQINPFEDEGDLDYYVETDMERKERSESMLEEVLDTSIAMLDRVSYCEDELARLSALLASYDPVTNAAPMIREAIQILASGYIDLIADQPNIPYWSEHVKTLPTVLQMKALQARLAEFEPDTVVKFGNSSSYDLDLVQFA
jgi:hypothetical protein